MANRSEIESLIFLLDDPDEFVRGSVIQRFKSLGEQSVPVLDEIRVTIRDPEKRKTLDDLVLQITFSGIENEFLNLLEGGLNSMEELETAVLMLCRLDNPTIREELYVRKLNQLALEIQPEITYTLQPLRQAEILMYHLFVSNGFRAPDQESFSPRQTQLADVLDHRQGIPLTLTFVALFVARRLELALSGVNMPIHFLMRYDFDSQVVYLDPFNKGKIVTVEECLRFLKRNNIRPEQEYFEVTSPILMLLRTLRNLQNAYQSTGDTLRTGYVNVLIAHLEHIHRQ